MELFCSQTNLLLGCKFNLIRRVRIDVTFLNSLKFPILLFYIFINERLGKIYNRTDLQF